MPVEPSPLVLVTGASGYIGGRLVPRLLELGYRVRCVVRDPAHLQGRPWRSRVEVLAGNVLEPKSMQAALSDVAFAYYLVHSMAAGAGYSARDVAAARSFAAAARAAGVARIIYLGGLARGNSAAALSEHLSSRLQTGDALRTAGVPVTEFQASVIVGSGSASFEIIRYLTERLPIMICPRWVYTRTQPIGIREVVEYLTSALKVEASRGRIIEIGGADVITYGQMMTTYAEVRGLRRSLIPVPVLTPRLSSYWVNVVTPIPAAIARPLIDGLRNESLVRDTAARQIFPEIEPTSYRTSVQRALAALEASSIQSTWSDALSSSYVDATPPAKLTTHEGLVVERRQRSVACEPADAFAVIAGLGGERGWLYMNWAWRIRGAIDRLLGGVGLRRGRRHADELRVGDALDFWRVEAVEANRMIRLRAEMKVPGHAWLQFDVAPARGGGSILRQTAFFAPHGLSGWLYWYGLYPVHALIFSGLIDRIARRVSGGRTVRSRSPDNREGGV